MYAIQDRQDFVDGRQNFPLLNEVTFDILKKDVRLQDPLHEALYFFLNRCSSLGMVSHGEFDAEL